MAVPAAGVIVEEVGAVMVGDGVLSGCAEAAARMVRLARRLKMGTRELNRAVDNRFQYG